VTQTARTIVHEVSFGFKRPDVHGVLKTLLDDFPDPLCGLQIAAIPDAVQAAN
jgi:hypothetical protein